MKSKKKAEKEKPKVNPKLDGFEIKIDSLGEIRSSFEIDKINKFLNKEVEDKKLMDRPDFNDIKKEDTAKEKNEDSE